MCSQCVCPPIPSFRLIPGLVVRFLPREMRLFPIEAYDGKQHKKIGLSFRLSRIVSTLSGPKLSSLLLSTESDVDHEYSECRTFDCEKLHFYGWSWVKFGQVLFAIFMKKGWLSGFPGWLGLGQSF